jgi:hypothetical protein
MEDTSPRRTRWPFVVAGLATLVAVVAVTALTTVLFLGGGDSSVATESNRTTIATSLPAPATSSTTSALPVVTTTDPNSNPEVLARIAAIAARMDELPDEMLDEFRRSDRAATSAAFSSALSFGSCEELGRADAAADASRKLWDLYLLQVRTEVEEAEAEMHRNVLDYEGEILTASLAAWDAAREVDTAPDFQTRLPSDGEAVGEVASGHWLIAQRFGECGMLG